MNTIDLCIMIKGGLSPLFECTPAPREGVRVRTPMMYPDGGIVDVFVLDRGGSYTLTDFGDTLGWLRMQTVSPRRTSKQVRLVEDVCQTLGVELYQGQLVLRECAPHELSETRSFASLRPQSECPISGLPCDPAPSSLLPRKYVSGSSRDTSTSMRMLDTVVSQGENG